MLFSRQRIRRLAAILVSNRYTYKIDQAFPWGAFWTPVVFLISGQISALQYLLLSGFLLSSNKGYKTSLFRNGLVM